MTDRREVGGSEGGVVYTRYPDSGIRVGEVTVVCNKIFRTGPIGARLNRREFDAVQNHMHEEGENLRQIVESTPISVK